MKYTYYPWKTGRGREYATHGFCRRVGTLRRALVNVYKIIPSGTVRVPSRNRLYDAQINIQACIANVYGCIYNLAWVWVYEKGLEKKISRNRVGLRKTNTAVRDSLRPAFRDYLEARDDWMDYLVDFRDALAHRIPLYVPPGSIPRAKIDEYIICERGKNDALRWLNFAEYDRLGAEQNKMLLFQPMMTHSLIEMGKLVLFHDRFFDSRRTWQQDVRGTESTLICGIHF